MAIMYDMVLDNKIVRESFDLHLRELIYPRDARSFLPSDRIDEVDETRELDSNKETAG